MRKSKVGKIKVSIQPFKKRRVMDKPITDPLNESAPKYTIKKIPRGVHPEKYLQNSLFSWLHTGLDNTYYHATPGDPSQELLSLVQDFQRIESENSEDQK